LKTTIPLQPCLPWAERTGEGDSISRLRVCNPRDIKYKIEYMKPTCRIEEEGARKGKTFVPAAYGQLKRRNWTGLREWINRYVVLDQENGQLLFYRVDEDEEKIEAAAVAKLALPPGTQCSCPGHNRFSIVFPNGYELLFDMPDSDLMKYWRDNTDTLLSKLKEPEEVKGAEEEKLREQQLIESAASDAVTLIMKKCGGDLAKVARVFTLINKDPRMTRAIGRASSPGASPRG